MLTSGDGVLLYTTGLADGACSHVLQDVRSLQQSPSRLYFRHVGWDTQGGGGQEPRVYSQDGLLHPEPSAGAPSALQGTESEVKIP